MEKRDYSLFDRDTEAVIFGYQQNAIQRMLDFDYVCRREKPSVTCIVNPTRGGLHQAFWGNKTLLIPMYRTLKEAMDKHPQIDVMVNFASFRSAYPITMEAMDYPNLRTIAIIAEGIPERRSKEIITKANRLGKNIIGPATVGGLKAGAFKIGNTAGMLDNIIDSKLHRPGSVAYVSKSGGLSNELNKIISMNADGIYEGVALGGDRYPGSLFIDHIMRYEANPDIKMIVLLGEIGGRDEYAVVDALKSGKITKPVVAWCIGTSAKMFPSGVQFGHAGARADAEEETADAKNVALKEAGAIVPNSYNDFGEKVKMTFDKLVSEGKATPAPEVTPPPIPQDYNKAMAAGTVRRKPQFIATISDDRGEELRYCGVPISKVIEEDYGLGGVIGLLWFKKKLPKWATKYLEMVILITADHGPAVSGAHNAIVTARAGKDLISSLVSGLLTIGPRFGGAVQGSAEHFTQYLYKGEEPLFMVKDMKKKNINIQGIGHRIKSVTNPDVRVELLVGYAKENFPQTETLDYALEVEKLTTSKKNNLILNVDGCIGVLTCDMLKSLGYSRKEVTEFVKLGGLNALFVLGRSIGFMGHIMDQKRLSSRLYRHPWDDIAYMMPDEPDAIE